MLQWIYLGMTLLTLVWVVLWWWSGRIPLHHQAEVSRHFDISAEALWRILTDFAGYPRWQPGLSNVSEVEPGLWEEQYAHRALRLKTLAWEPHSRLLREIVSDKLPFGGTWEYLIQPEAGGCRLTIIERGWVQDRLFRLLAHLFLGYETSLQQFLDHLSKAATQP